MKFMDAVKAHLEGKEVILTDYPGKETLTPESLARLISLNNGILVVQCGVLEWNLRADFINSDKWEIVNDKTLAGEIQMMCRSNNCPSHSFDLILGRYRDKILNDLFKGNNQCHFENEDMDLIIDTVNENFGNLK